MKTPFKMTPGRGNMPKTGRGISPTLMSKSPMYQTGDVEKTGYGMMKEKESRAKVKADPAGYAKRDKEAGMTRNFATNELKPNAYEKKYLPGGEGQNDRIIDGAGKVIAESKGTHPNARKKLKAEYDRAKLITDTQRSNKTEVLNAFGGGTPTEKLSEKQKQALINATRAKVSETPAKQMSKGAFKKPAMTSTTAKPKASKTPMKQYIDPKAKEREQKRLKDMTPSQRKAEGTSLAGDRGRIKREGPTGPQKGKMDTKSNRKSPAMQMSKLKKKSC
jgi:hypothetical protein